MSLSSIINSNGNNLVGWYDASDASTLMPLSKGSNEISQWNNKASNQNNLTYWYNGIPNSQTADNGMTHINFPSAGGYGTCNNGMDDYKDSNGNIVLINTIFMAANLAHDYPYIPGLGASGLFCTPGIDTWPIVGLGGKTLVDWDNPHSTYYINGELNSTQNPTTNSQGIEEYYPLNVIQINLSSAASFKFVGFPYCGCGNIGEVLFFSNIVSESDSNNIYLYLKNKWNKPVTYPPNSCLHTMTPAELICYQQNNPDLKLKGLTTASQLQNNWTTYGCTKQELRNNQCPSYQTSSGQYNFIGCYNVNKKNETNEITPLPNDRGLVNSIDDCQAIANNNNESIFGVHNAAENGGKPQCFTGNDLYRATMYGLNVNRNQCTALGGNSTNQLYQRTKPFPPPAPVLPLLTTSNFSNTIETFENRKKNKFLILLLLLIFIIWIFYIYKK
jgi:hypothetical protein